MLFQEGRCIQKHLTVAPNTLADSQAAHTFNYLMLQRKVTATLCVISKDTKGGVLSLDEPIPTGFGPQGSDQLVLMKCHEELWLRQF